MDFAPKSKPSIKAHIEANWENFKDKSIHIVKKELKDTCSLENIEDMTALGHWFNNKKKKEKN